MLDIQQTDDALIFCVYVQPRASQNTIVGHHDKALKIKLTAPPVDNAANKQCIQVLAKALRIPKSSITIIGGQTHRTKRLKLQSAADAFTKEKLADLKRKLHAIAGG